MGLAKLGAVTLIKNEDDALVPQIVQLMDVPELADSRIQLLDGGNDQLVIPCQLPYQRVGVIGTINASFAEAVKFLDGLVIQVFTVHHEHHLVHLGDGGQYLGGFKRCEFFPSLWYARYNRISVWF
jgi:methyl coenzyme M reductase beta subunit